MINLTPISENIQKRLFEKMSVLGREQMAINNTVTSPGVLTHDKLATRSTFLRMTSGLGNPVILVGGELTGDFNMAAGYEDIYGPRTKLDRMGHERLTQLNKFKRPMPGLKSADISFRGGIRAFREATISWTCWSFDDITRLSPHFLSPGVDVLLEWAWVYDEFSLQNLPTLYDKSRGMGIKKRSAYQSYSEIVDANQGDFDFMVGMVKNFEYTTRADGGFDCQTKITSVGASILTSNQQSTDVITESTTYNISKSEDPDKIISDIKKAIKSKNPQKLIDFDTGGTLKSFIAYIDTYLRWPWNPIWEMAKNTDTKDRYFHKPFASMDNFAITDSGHFYGKKGAYLVHLSTEEGRVNNAWVQWGWFEDNILSKFLSLVAPAASDPFVTKFRSVENTGGGYESVRIMNHKDLQTVDINKFILPGQLFPFNPSGQKKTLVSPGEISSKRTRTPDPDELHVEDLEKEELAPPPSAKGDPALIFALKNVLDPYFEPFSTDSTSTSVVSEIRNVHSELSKLEKGLEGSGTVDAMGLESGLGIAGTKTESRTVSKPGYQGYLRNMLINTKLIKEAFGVDDEGKFTLESVNVKEALENLLSMLNSDINMWDFRISQDEVETNRSKIVDDQIIAIDLQQKLKINDPIVMDPGAKSKYTQGTLLNNGVFFFPVWDHRSMVKSQNITSKIPNAMALSIMYGAGFDELKTMGTIPPEIDSKEGTALAKMFSEYHSKNPNVNTKNIDIALKQTGYEKVGAIGTEPLSREGGDDNIKDWLKVNSKTTLRNKYEEKIERIRKQLDVHGKTDLSSDVELTIEGEKEGEKKTLPFPLPEQIIQDPKYWNSIMDVGDDKSQKIANIYHSKYHNTGKMKQQFIDTIRALITGTGEVNIDSKKPLLIPLDLELAIDGIGGIIPGNSFHSSYLPERYQEETLFQAFDVNHTVDGSGWTTTITGKMRTTFEKAVKKVGDDDMKAAMESLSALKKGLDKEVENQRLAEEVAAAKAANEAVKQNAKDKRDGKIIMVGGKEEKNPHDWSGDSWKNPTYLGGKTFKELNFFQRQGVTVGLIKPD